MSDFRQMTVPLLALSILVFTTCTPPASNTSNNQSANAETNTVSQPVVQTVADGDWPGYNRTLDGQRYSPLKQITPENVASLRQVCAADLGEAGNYQSGLVVVNNTLFATTDTNTFAFDPATCQQKWKHHYEYTARKGALKVNRGVAYLDGKVYRGIGNGSLIAIDANTGQQVWEAKVGDMVKGRALPQHRSRGTEWSLWVRPAATIEAFADECMDSTQLTGRKCGSSSSCPSKVREATPGLRMIRQIRGRAGRPGRPTPSIRQAVYCSGRKCCSRF